MVRQGTRRGGTGVQDYAFLTTNAGRTNLNATLANASINNVGGILNVNADATNLDVTVDALTTFTVTQSLDSLVINGGGVAVLGGPAAFAAPGLEELAAALLLAGFASLFGRRRRAR